MTRSAELRALLLPVLPFLCLGVAVGRSLAPMPDAGTEDCITPTPRQAGSTPRALSGTKRSNPPPAHDVVKPTRPWVDEARAITPSGLDSPVTECDDTLCVAVWTTEAESVADALPSMVVLNEAAAASGLHICTRARLVGLGHVVLHAHDQGCDTTEAVSLRAQAMVDDIVESQEQPQDTAAP